MEEINHRLSAEAEFDFTETKDISHVMDTIMTAYGQDILQLVYTYVQDEGIAEDLTQDIFLKCYSNLDQFKQRSRLKTWLYRIAINSCKDYLKSWSHRKFTLQNTILNVLSTKDKDVDEQVIQKDEEARLAEAVMALPVVYREVIFLHYFEAFTVHEIGQAVGKSPNTIKSRLKRARTLLKEKLGPEQEEG
ncbi:sigma-70 family RNA polymerase sigma factor [Caldalkalibacillus salinus]|uniref:sigma-70 family RNA polymerase sigma factor n=1 Tax=Caldalkalibacillus salinus TaxID=2803787 RepID=UPI003015A3A0